MGEVRGERGRRARQEGWRRPKAEGEQVEGQLGKQRWSRTRKTVCSVKVAVVAATPAACTALAPHTEESQHGRCPAGGSSPRLHPDSGASWSVAAAGAARTRVAVSPTRGACGPGRRSPCDRPTPPARVRRVARRTARGGAAVMPAQAARRAKAGIRGAQPRWAGGHNRCGSVTGRSGQARREPINLEGAPRLGSNFRVGKSARGAIEGRC